MDNEDELFPLVDIEGNVTGHILRREAHDGSKKLHPVVHMHVINSSGELYLQKRPMWKDIQPGYWDTACDGHIDYGETTEEALRREVMEELGMTLYTPVFLKRYIFESDKEKELIYVFITIYNNPISPNATELEGGRFWTISEISSNLGVGIFTPNFEYEFQTVLMPTFQNMNTHCTEL